MSTVIKPIFNSAVPALTCARPAAWNQPVWTQRVWDQRQAHALGVAQPGRYAVLGGLAGQGRFAGLTPETAAAVMRDRAVAGGMSRANQEAPKPIKGIVADGVTDPPIWRRLART